MKVNHTYLPVLQWACRTHRPVRILEWGPGRSTEEMLRLCPNAHILSIEHDKRWYERWRLALDVNGRLELTLLNHTLSPARDTGYATYPLRHSKGGFDLVFVDGRSRCDCLVVARLALRPKGIVILHDSERKAYREGVDYFEWHRDVPGLRTMVLSTAPTEIPTF